MRFTAPVVALLLSLSAACLAQSTTRPTTAPTFEEQVRALKAAGEPVEPADLKVWPTLPDDRNAAKVLFALDEQARNLAADRRDYQRHLSKRGITEYRAPLSEQDVAEIRQALAPEQETLRQLDQITALDGFDWGAAPAGPLAAVRGKTPPGTYWGRWRHLLYLDGLLAIAENDGPRAWRRVEAIRRLGEGNVAALPMRGGSPEWPYLFELAARLAGDVVTSPAARDVDRAALSRAIEFWLDERRVLDAGTYEFRCERVAVIDTYQRINRGELNAGELANWGRFQVNELPGRRIGIPMWPHVVEYFGVVVDAFRQSKTISREDSGWRLTAAHEAFARGGFVPMHVAMTLGPGTAARHLSLRRLRAAECLAATATAIHLYRHDNAGTFPAALEELVPKYLSAVPTDPTSEEAGAVCYRVDGRHSLIWVAGANGADDGGKPRPADLAPWQHDAPYDEVLRLVPAAGSTSQPSE